MTMDLIRKFDDLLKLLIDFKDDRASNHQLRSFAWDVIDYFTDTPSNELPAEEKFERVFWYTIWQIQHLCDESHQNDGATKRELLKTLAYMRGEKKLPENFVGRRP